MLVLVLLLFSSALRYGCCEFSETTETFHVSEAAPPQTVIGKVQLTPGWSYRISSSDSRFSFNHTDGEIKLLEQIDREKTNGSVRFLLVSIPPSIIHIVVVIDDVNDSDPEFPTSVQNTSIVESASVGSRLFLLPAIDRDNGENGTIAKYTMSGEAPFELQMEGDVPALVLREALDREVKDSYTVTVTAEDSGTPPRSGTTTVTIAVLDVNDNPPRFSQSKYETQWNGDTSKAIMELQADDADFGEAAMVDFSVIGTEGRDFYFDGNKLFAKSSTPKCCSSSQCDECVLTVVASDRGVPLLSTTAVVNVKLNKDNLHDPVIHVKLHPSDVDFAIIERDAVAGKSIAVLTVTDEDGPLGGPSLSLLSGNDDSAFSLIVQKQFSILRLLKSASELTRPLYDLVFEANDGQKQARTSTKTLRVYNQAQSPESFVYVEKEKYVKMSEDDSIGSYVTQMSTNSSGCQFTMGKSELFEIDRLSGIMTLKSRLNASEMQRHMLHVNVQLPPPNLRTLTSTVEVEVEDVNDHVPYFLNLPADITFPEDAPIGTTIFQIRAIDEDIGANARLTYSIKEGTNQNYFNVDKNSGKISLRQSLDFEENRKMEIQVVVTDQGTPKRSNTSLLILQVQDVNDNRPQFECIEHHSTLPLHHWPRSIVATVTATDKDSGSYGRVTYALLDSPFGFAIDKNTGVLKLATSLKKGVHEVRIGALDGGGLTSMNNCTVFVHVTNAEVARFTSADEFDLNERHGAQIKLSKPPKRLRPTSSHFSLDGSGSLSFQNEPTTIFNTSVVAEYEGYSISKCIRIVPMIQKEKNFRVSEETIHISKDTPLGKPLLKLRGHMNESFDTSCHGMYVDSGTLFLRTNEMNVDQMQCFVNSSNNESTKITVINEHLQEKVHLSRVYVFRVRENSAMGTKIGSLPETSSLVYSTSFVGAIGLFPNGVLYVRRPLDAANETKYAFNVNAILKDKQYKFSTTVRVHVEDVNDNSPLCPEQKEFHIDENIEAGTTIGLLEAADYDDGRNSVLVYRLLTQNVALRIDAVSGMVVVTQPFDAELQSNFTFRYEVSDQGVTKKRVQCEGKVLIHDVNDNSPQFDARFYKITLAVNELLGPGNITRVVAHDRDSGRNQQIFYYLANYDDLFQISNSTGQLLLNGTLHENSEYNVTVVASDLGSPPLSSKTFVLITTEKETDVDVQFYSNLTIRIGSSASPGDIVGKVRAESENGHWMIRYSTDDERFHIDGMGNVILLETTEKLSNKVVSITAASDYRNVTKLHQIELFDDFQDISRTIKVKENSAAPRVLTVFKDGFEASSFRVVPQNEAFHIQQNQLFLARPLDREKESEYKIIITDNKNKMSVVTVQVLDENDEKPVCIPTAILVNEFPTSTQLFCEDKDENQQIRFRFDPDIFPGIALTETGLLTVSNMLENLSLVAVRVSDQQRGRRNEVIMPITLIRNISSPSVAFSTDSISMLVTNSQEIGAPFGRISIDSSAPVDYFLLGTDSLTVDRKTGQVSAVKHLATNVNGTLVAATKEGIATTNISVEVVEDVLILPKTHYFFAIDNASEDVGIVDLHIDSLQLHLDDDNFELEGNVLRKKGPLEEGLYDLTITVTKGRLTSEVFVTVFKTSHNIPSFDTKFEYWIPENVDVGFPVGQLPGSSKFSIHGDVDLEIDESNIIRSTKTLDREQASLYEFKIFETVSNGGQLEHEAILFVDDENDNVPLFANEEFRIQISEAVESNTPLLQLKWDDPDFNNAFWFAITEGNEFEQFEMNLKGQLVVVKPLDREFFAEYRLNVSIYDGIAPFPYHSSWCTVVVTVLDENDNAPQFSTNTIFTVDEDAARGFVFGNVKATDIDSDSNSDITYRVVPHSLPRAEFLIDAVSGDLIVNTKLNCTEQCKYEFELAASDMGTMPKITTQKVKVLVQDAHQQVPKFTQHNVTVNISESTRPHTRIYQLQLDEVHKDRSLFWLESGDESLFTVTPRSGAIELTAQLDYETAKTHQLVVAVRNLFGSATDYQTVVVNIEDSNDEAPRFVDGSSVHFSVFENLAGPFPVVIGSTIAEDDDSSEGGRVAYSVVKGNTSLFAVNSTTGELLLLDALDREQFDNHTVTVEAIDSGTPRHSSTADIIITVLDLNDNAPVFPQPYYVFRITENRPIGTIICKIKATDADTGENGNIRYSLLESDVPFAIGMMSGDIKTVAPIDRELKKMFQFTVVATDNGEFEKHATAVKVTVVVEDENDNPPKIMNKHMDAFVRNTTRIGEVVFVVDGFDADENSNLRYSLSGADARFFRINEFGEIILQDSIARKQFCSVTVGLVDGGHQSTSASFTFYTYDGSKFPRFKTAPTSVVLEENFIGDATKFEAVSAFARESSLQYSILAGNDGAFEMDPATGVLKVINQLDRETRDSYRMWISVQDGSDPPLTSHAPIDVIITDDNDEAPMFEQVVYEVEMSENVEEADLLTVVAFDRDNGPNGTVSYSILSGNENGHFDIDEDSGLIRVVRTLDREKQAKHEIVVEARDHGKPSLSETALVKVQVLDEDDNAPKFTRLFHASIPEDIEEGTSIHHVSATDDDELANHTFCIENEQEVPFSINAVTGEIFVSATLDRELVPSYRLRIRVEDAVWSVRTTVAITVTDVNDNAPVFEKSNYLFIVNSTNDVIGVLSAKDSDAGENSLLTYYLNEDSAYVAVDPLNGTLMWIQKQTAPKILQFHVTVEDSGVPSRSSQAIVTVLRMGEEDTIKDTTIVTPPAEQARLVWTYPNNTVTSLLVGENKNIMLRNGTELLLIGNQSINNVIVVFETLLGYLNIFNVIVLVKVDSDPVQSSATVIPIIVKEMDKFYPLRRAFEKRNSVFENSSPRPLCATSASELEGASFTIRDFPDIVLKNRCIERIEELPSSFSLTVATQKVHVTRTINVVQMRAKRLEDMEDVTVNVSSTAANGTILYVGEEEEAIFVADEQNVRVRGSNVVYVRVDNATDFTANVYSIAKFSRKFKKFPLEVHMRADEPSVEIFSPNRIVAIRNISDVQDAIASEIRNNESCSIVGRTSLSQQLFTIGNVTKLWSTKTANPIELMLKKYCSGRLLSTSEVTVEVQRSVVEDRRFVGFVRENTVNNAILQLVVHDVNHRYAFNIADDNLRNVFAVSRDHVLTNLVPLDRERRSLYRIPITITKEAQVDRPIRELQLERTTAEAIVIVDDVIESEVVENTTLRVTIVRNSNFDSVDVVGCVRPVTNDDTRNFSCVPIDGPWTVNSSCHLIASSEAEPSASLGVNANSTFGVSANYSVAVTSMFVNDEMTRALLSVRLLTTKEGVANFIHMLTFKYPDLTIVTIAMTEVAPFTVDLVMAFFDHHQNRIFPREARDLIVDFLSKSTSNSVELLSTEHSYCDDVVCQNNGRCVSSIAWSDERFSLRGKSLLLNLPKGKLEAICECPEAVSGDHCETRNDGCDKKSCVFGDCNDDGTCVCHADFHGPMCAYPKITDLCDVKCVHGSCNGGSCVCSSGFTGSDCSLPIPSSTFNETKTVAPMKTTRQPTLLSCSTMACGSGECGKSAQGHDICRCEDGVEGATCDYDSDTISISENYFELYPTAYFFNALQQTSSNGSCDTVQSISFDFRSALLNGVVLMFEFGDDKAVVELLDGELRFRQFDNYRTPLQITLDQKIEVAVWYRITLQMSLDKKSIIFKSNGIGKEAKAQVMLPTLLSSNLKKITIGGGDLAQFNCCIRRVVISGQLQSFKSDVLLRSQFFITKGVGSSEMSCSVAITSQLSTGAIVSIVVSAFIVGCLLLTFLGSKLFFYWRNTKATGWQDAKEIGTFSGTRGHVNSAMSRSTESRIYDIAASVPSVQYETPNNATHQSFTIYEQAETLPITSLNADSRHYVRRAGPPISHYALATDALHFERKPRPHPRTQLHK